MTYYLSILDIILLVAIFISTVISVLRGFTKEVLSITGWLLAIFGTLYSFPYTKPLAHTYITIDWLADGVLFAVTFLIILGSFFLISNSLAKKMKKSDLGSLDRLLGGIFGVLRGLLVIIFAYYVILLLLPYEEHPDWLKNGKLMPHIIRLSTNVMHLIPIENLSERMGTIKEILEGIREDVKEP